MFNYFNILYKVFTGHSLLPKVLEYYWSAEGCRINKQLTGNTNAELEFHGQLHFITLFDFPGIDLPSQYTNKIIHWAAKSQSKVNMGFEYQATLGI